MVTISLPKCTWPYILFEIVTPLIEVVIIIELCVHLGGMLLTGCS